MEVFAGSPTGWRCMLETAPPGVLGVLLCQPAQARVVGKLTPGCRWVASCAGGADPSGGSELAAGEFIAEVAALALTFGKPAWVAAPEVGSMVGNLESFGRWSNVIRAHDLPAALTLCEDAAEWPLPWQALDALIIGGTMPFKQSAACADHCKVARRRGVPVHMRHARTRELVAHAAALGCTSVDPAGAPASSTAGTYLAWVRDAERRAEQSDALTPEAPDDH